MRRSHFTFRLFVESLAIIFGVEALIMVLLGRFAPELEGPLEMILDASSLAFAAGPLLLWRMNAEVKRLEPESTPGEVDAARVATEAKRSAIFMALTMLVVGTGCSLLGAWWMHKDLYAKHEARFGALAGRVTDEIQRGFADHLIQIQGTRGLFDASEHVSRGEFRTYAASQRAAGTIGGSTGIGFVQRVPRGELEAFTAAQRADEAPEFAVRTSGGSAELYVVTFVEPLDEHRSEVGYDIGSDPVRREVAERAMLTGEPTLSGKVTLILNGQPRDGALCLLPVYRNGASPKTPEERRRELVGWVYAPLLLEEELSNVGVVAEGLLDVEVYDGPATTAATLMYDDDGVPDAVPAGSAGRADETRLFQRRTTFTTAGREWTAWLGTTRAFDAQHGHAALILTGGGGVLVSVLLALVVFALGTGRARAVAMAQAMTANLNASKARAEEALRESEALRRTVDEHSLVSVADAEGRITEVNEALCRVSGYSSEELLGQDHRVFNSGYHPKTYWAQMWQTLSSGNAWRGEVCNKAKDGSQFWVDTIVAPFLGADGKIEKYVSLRSDITTRKRAEEELYQSQDELEIRVSERTAELVEATMAAESASRAKSEFLAHMSHEIRTPLNGVIGMTDLLLDSGLTESQRRFAQLAKSSGELLTGIINDILDFSKMEAGKLEIVANDFDLHDTAEEVMAVLARAASAKNLELACYIDPAVPVKVRGDGDRLRQVLINLINNGIKFTERGSVVLRLAAQPQDDGHTTVRFTITDTGVGIPRDRIGRLFQAFSQADASTTRVYGGTGLGLVISKQLAELMGGEIGVDSEAGVGSTFWFTIVLESRERPGSSAMAREHLDPRELRVLAVDDYDVQRSILCEQIESWGMRAEVAPDGERALQAIADAVAEGDPFQVALVDMDMPGMDGVEFAAAVKARPEISDTVMVILVSVDSDVDPAWVREIGCVGCMTKPVKQSALFDTIMDALATSNRNPSSAPPRDEPGAGDAPGGPAPAQSGPRILVAEDNEINQILVKEVLSRMGLRCELVENGQLAVEQARSGQFDLVLMDCQMPVMDGFDAAREIRRLEQAEQIPGESAFHIPIVALTANAMRGDRERCLEAGMDDYATKPINPKELLNTIERVLSGGSDVAAAA